MIRLPERTSTILKIIVGEYIGSGVAISSDAIYRGYSLNISPATIRHEMAYLEEKGFINRPHPTAGSVPSDKGYRYYVEDLMDRGGITAEERAAIRRRFKQASQEPDKWAYLAVSILTQKLRTIAIATPLRTPLCHFRHLNLVALEGPLILMVLVLGEGKIKQQFLSINQRISQDALTAAANKMNKFYAGLTVPDIRALSLELSPIEETISKIVERVMDVEDVQQHDQCYLDGWRYLLAQADMIRGNRMLSLVDALERRTILHSLLANIENESGIRVTIGTENEEEALQECSVVMSNYGVGERRGAIGVIGPTRMPYNRVIPIVDYVSSLMSELVSKTYS